MKAINSLSERNGGNTQELLKHAKNKYYLKREHLNEINPPQTSIIRTPCDRDEKEKKILPGMDEKHDYTLVLDLDETLVHFVAKEKKFKLRPGCI